MNGHKSKLGVLGGLFDPIHNGHISLCLNAKRQLGLDYVLLIPAYNPPHREAVSDYHHRIAMVKLAVREYEFMRASDLESSLKGPSFTVHTLKKLKYLYPESDLYFIIGADNLRKMEEWHKPSVIFELAGVVMAERLGEENGLAGEFAGRIIKLEMTPVDISSTHVREMVRKGQPLNSLVPFEVEDYIKGNGLYV